MCRRTAALQGLVRPMTIRENVSLAVLDAVCAPVLHRPARPRHGLARERIARFGIRASGPEQMVGKLSGGNQQKVVLAKWLATKPRILIMDEPTRGIDVGAKAEIHRADERAGGRGLAILMISSELPEVLGMSDRVLVMRGGPHRRRVRPRRGDPGSGRRGDDARHAARRRPPA